MPATSKKAYKGKGMEGWIAKWYTRTRQKDLADFREQAQAVAKRLTSGSRVLEIAPGPGFFAIELKKLGSFTITGLDISRTFVEIATANARAAHLDVQFQLGSASAIPFPDANFDFCYCSAAFKNFSEPLEALNEMHRVLRPGGEARIVDLRKDVSRDEIDRYVEQSGRSQFDGWMTRWAFRTMLVKRAYTLDAFRQLAARSGFGGCQIDIDALGFEARLIRQKT